MPFKNSVSMRKLPNEKPHNIHLTMKPLQHVPITLWCVFAL